MHRLPGFHRAVVDHAFACANDGDVDHIVFDVPKFQNVRTKQDDLWQEFDSTKLTLPKIVPMPFISKGTKFFKDKQMIEISCADKDAHLFYVRKFDNGYVDTQFYNRPFEISESVQIAAFAFKNTVASMGYATFIKSTRDYDISLATPPAPQYSGNSPQALVDGVRGSAAWQLGGWQGFEGTDLVAVVDLKKPTAFHRLALSCVEDQNAWIFPPSEIQFLTSDDGVNFSELGKNLPKIGQNTEGSKIREFEFLKNAKARFIKIIARSLTPIPSWHKGAGGKGWIFADEILID